MIGVTYIACLACHRYTLNKATGSCENEHCAAHRPDSADKSPHAVPDWYSRAMAAQPKNAVPQFTTSNQSARPAPAANPAPIKVAAPQTTFRQPVLVSVPSPPIPAPPTPIATNDSPARTESEMRAVVERLAERVARRMSWGLLFLLAALGPMTQLIFSQDFMRDFESYWIPIAIVMFGLVIPLSCAGWIAKKAATKHFLHGFLVGFLFIASIAAFQIYESYQMYESMRAKLKTMIYSTLIGSAIAGLYFGFFAAIAIRLARRQWWKAVKITLLFIAVFAAIFKIGETIGR